jgi:predicted RNA-binding protein with TRAM domain
MYRPREGRGDRVAPVKVGDELEVTIEAVGEKGDGIAKKDGFVLFVPGAKQGETIKIRVTKVLRKVGFAEKAGGTAAPSQQAEETPAEESEEPAEDTEDFGEEE